MGILRKVYGNTLVLKAAAMRRGLVQSAPRHLQKMRDRRVRWMVRYAARTVPHYRDLFRDLGIVPGDIRGADDLACLPLLDKAAVSADPERFRSESHHGRRALRFKTSGSTGLPLSIYHDRRSILENMAYSEPERAVAKRLMGRAGAYRTLRINRPSSTLGEVQAFCAQNTLIPVKPEHHRVDVAMQPREVIERIRELEPDILGGYGAYLEMFFRYVHENGISLPLPRLVSYGAEGMTLPGRELITEQFGIPVVAAYNAVESFKIGFQCGCGPDYHLHEDLCHVRIVDPGGKDLPEGGQGTVVISNLVNRGTVLINYRLEDLASISPPGCDCGRSLKKLTGLQGRELDAIVLPGGSFVHAGAVWSILSKGSGVVRYQLVQQALDRFEVKLVTVDQESFERFNSQVVPGLRSIFGPAARIELSRHEKLLPGKSGKFRPIMSRVRSREGP